MGCGPLLRRVAEFRWLDAVALAVATGAFFAPAFFHAVPVGVDGAAYSFSYKLNLYQYLRAGSLPLWSDAIYAGFPLGAASQAGVFSPFNLLLELPVSFPTAYEISRWVAHFLAAWGAYLLAREIGAGRFGAFLAGLAFSLEGYLLGSSELLMVVQSAGLLPFLILASERWMKERRARWFIAAAVCFILMVLSGYPVGWFIGGVGFAAWGIARNPVCPREWVRWALPVLAGLALTLPVWLPVLPYSANSVRRNPVYEVYSPCVSLSATHAIGFIQPALSPASGGGRLTTLGYLGILPWVAAFWLLLSGPRSPQRTGVLSLCAAGVLLAILPSGSMLSGLVCHPARFLFLSNLGFALALGLLLSAAIPPRLAPGLLAYYALTGAAVWMSGQPIRLTPAGIVLLASPWLLLAPVTPGKRLRTVTFCALAAAVFLAETAAYVQHFWKSRYYPAERALRHPFGDLIAGDARVFSVVIPSLDEVDRLSERTGLALRAWSLWGQAGLIYGFRSVTGDESLANARTFEFSRALAREVSLPATRDGLRYLSGVRWVVWLERGPPPCTPVRALDLGDGYTLSLCDFSDALDRPLFYPDSAVEKVPLRNDFPPYWSALDRRLWARYAFWTEFNAPKKALPATDALIHLYVETPGVSQSVRPVAREYGPTARADVVTVEKWTPGDKRLLVDAPAPGFVFFNMSYDPGWRVVVDGLPAKAEIADYLFTAVPVPTGRHRIVLRYRPPPW